jgi:hypothetical protein
MKPSYCFDFDFELPGTVNLGPNIVTLQWGAGTSHTHTIDVKEFKRQG